jgi:hypothetical protein
MTRLSSNVAVVNPLTYKEWNDSVLRCNNCTVFHSANWARLLADSYGYHPTYLTIPDDSSFRACLPIMEVNSIFTGRRGVSLTFSDYCGALVEDLNEFTVLFDSALQMGKIGGWHYVEFRGEQFLSSELSAQNYAHHEIELIDDEVEMKARLRESTARNIRKAQKEGVTVKVTQSLQGVQEFYRLHCLTRKRQGVPPQPARFFRKLFEHVIDKGLGFTALATHGDAVVAGIICLYFGDRAIYKYGASNIDFQHLRANNLVLWESMMRCARQGCRSFSLGRTDLDNEGLMSFKNGWGGSRTTLSYYRYDFSASAFVSEPQRDLLICKTLLRKLPVALLRMVGTLAYRHIG